MSADAAVDIAFRTRAATLSIATTGSATLAATASGFTRTTGSFISDGFAVGMEVTPAGFTSTTPRLVTQVAALVLTVAGTNVAAASAGARLLTAGLPALRVYDVGSGFTPLAGRHYVEMELIAQPGQQLSAPSDGGTREDRGVYVFRWYGVAGTGVYGLRLSVDALLRLFTPGTTMALADGTHVRVRGDTTPSASQVLRGPAGFVFIAITVPWRRYAVNVIA